MENTDDAGEVEYTTSDAPKLVERCRDLQVSWRAIGIAEAINVPEDRPK